MYFGIQRKRADEEDEEVKMEEEEDVIGVTGIDYSSRMYFPKLMYQHLFLVDGLRPNALYLQGSPITHLPTNNIFAYSRHFGSNPVGLEWIDDSSCVLIFATTAACRTALSAFSKTAGEEPDFDGCITAKPIPLPVWPPEARINKSLGVTEGLEGRLLVRIARMDDKKVRGAAKRSAFYQKHGKDAGKDPNAHTIKRVPDLDGATKRRRMQDDDEERRRQLDEELDDFLREGSDEASNRSFSPPSSPPSKMRSDYIVENGRGNRGSLLQRTSVLRNHDDTSDDLTTHHFEGPQRRRRGGRNWRHVDIDMDKGRRGRGVKSEKTRDGRPAKTAEELDAELEAFLNDKS